MAQAVSPDGLLDSVRTQGRAHGQVVERRPRVGPPGRPFLLETAWVAAATGAIFIKVDSQAVKIETRVGERHLILADPLS